MTEQEFFSKIRRVNDTRIYTFTNSYTVRDYYYYFKRFNKNLTELQFSTALRAIFKVLFNNLINSRDAVLPNLGKLDVRKMEREIKIVDNKVVTNLPINWDETLRLWYNDESSRKKKTLVRCDSDKVFSINYNKRNARYKNKEFIKFKTSRKLKLALKKAIIENNLDSFSYEKY